MADDREPLQRRLRALFAEELQENLRTLTQGLLRLERDATGDADVRELFRAAHGLKGAAHAAGVGEAVRVCDRMESTFAGVRDGELPLEPNLIATLLADVDALQAVAATLRGNAAAASEVAPARPSTGALFPAPGAKSPAPGSVRVAVDKLNALLTTAGETFAASRRLQALSTDIRAASVAVEACRQGWRALRGMAAPGLTQQGLQDLDHDIEEAFARLEDLERSVTTVRRDVGQAATAVAEAAQGLRLQPVADACEGLDRVVRDVAADSGKQAQFVLRGGGVEVDRAVVAALRDPLLHLVRNAIDHGLEPPDDRLAAGKAPIGTVTVSAQLRQRVLAVVVTDDGLGMDVEALRGAAERRGVAVPSSPLELAFVPGVSTGKTVTAVSGRGVGLDAVRAGVEAIGGSVAVASEPGAGTAFTLLAPTTLATMGVLVAQAAGEVLCLPMAALERVSTVPSTKLREVEGQTVISIDGGTRRVLSLAGSLQLADDQMAGARLDMALIRGTDVAFVVDRFIEQIDVLVKPAPVRLAGMASTLGIAILSDGSPALVVNPPALLRSATTHSVVLRQPVPASRRPRILLAEDTVTTRALERSILESAGYDVVVAVDGAHAWQLLQSEEVDLVVTDVQMPGLDGFQLCEAIRGAPSLRDLPVVLVTSLASDDDRRRGIDAGADAYFAKSDFRQGSLLDSVQRLL